MGIAEVTKIVQFDPAALLVDDDIRFSRKRHRIDTLKASILSYGSVHTPIEVEPLPAPTNGKTHRVTVGGYRTISVEELNRIDKAGLTVPAIVRSAGTPLDRLKRQLSENMDRENMSPLDTAISIKQLIDAGVSKSEIRTIFARPGGKKGTEVQPASNAWVNMMLSFLDLPQPIQEKIHLGLVGVGAAYELTKVSPEKRQVVLDKAEIDRLKEIDQEDKEDKKLLSQEKKAEEVNAELEAKKALLQITKDELAIAEQAHAAKVKEGSEAFNAAKVVGLSAEDRTKAQEHFRALQTDIKGAENLIVTKKKAVDSLEQKLSGVQKTAAEVRTKLASARAKGKGEGKKEEKKSPGVTAHAIKTSAKEAGDGNHVPLTLVQVRSLLAKMANSRYPTVKKIGKALIACCDGVPTESETVDEIAVLVREKVAPKVKPQATK